MLAKALKTSTSRHSPSNRFTAPFLVQRTSLPPLVLLPPSAQMSTSTPTPAAASTSKVHQPTWTPPVVELEEPVLKVWNSLTRSKVSSPLFSRDTKETSSSLPLLLPLPFPAALSIFTGRVHSHAISSGHLVQLWTYSLRRFPYGPRSVSLSFKKSKGSELNLPPLPFELTRPSPLLSCRNYVTQDVLRRIMRDYFGYDVHFVQNITDIEDKVRLSASFPFSLELELISRLLFP